MEETSSLKSFKDNLKTIIENFQFNEYHFQLVIGEERTEILQKNKENR